MKVKDIFPRLHLVTFAESYDLAMHFLRYQEYYESPKFRGKRFTILEFMDWYSKTYGKGVFTYPNDWGGFNIPGKIIREVHKGISDFNHYDHAMWKLYSDCIKKSGDENFYIIGTKENHDKNTLDHETAHALYHLDKNYRKEAKLLVETMDNVTFDKMSARLLKQGYHRSVLIDEVQAYMVGSNKDKRFGILYAKYYKVHQNSLFDCL